MFHRDIQKTYCGLLIFTQEVIEIYSDAQYSGNNVPYAILYLLLKIVLA